MRSWTSSLVLGCVLALWCAVGWAAEGSSASVLPTELAQAAEQVAAFPWDADANRNAGLAAAWEGRLGEAVLYFERALRLRPLDRELREGLHVLREQIWRARSAAHPQLRLTQGEPPGLWWWRVCGVFPQRLYGIIALAAVWLACGLWWLRGRLAWSLRRDLVSVSSLLLAGLCVVALGLWGGAQLARRSSEPVVVVAAAPQARLAPDPLAGVVENPDLYEGAVVVVRSREGEWSQVELSSGARVWLPGAELRSIGPSDR